MNEGKDVVNEGTATVNEERDAVNEGKATVNEGTAAETEIEKMISKRRRWLRIGQHAILKCRLPVRRSAADKSTHACGLKYAAERLIVRSRADTDNSAARNEKVPKTYDRRAQWFDLFRI